MAVYTDNDVSATSARSRPGYERLLDAIRAGSVDAVVAYKSDRLHRDVQEHLTYHALAAEHGVVTHTVSGGRESIDSADDFTVSTIKAAFDQAEAMRNSERSRRAALQRAKKGEYSGGRRPFGWEVDGVTEIPEEVEALQVGTDLALAGTPSNEIARRWNAAGIKTSMGNDWVGSQVTRVLKRPRNAGLRVHRGEVIGEGVWDAVVEVSKWKALKVKFNDPARRSNYTDSKVKYLGSGLFLCGVCGDTITSTVSKGIMKYACNGRHVVRQMEPVDELVVEAVMRRLDTADPAQLMPPDTGDDAGALLDDRAEVRRKLDELATMYADDLIDASQFATSSERLRGRLDELDDRLAAAADTTPLAAFAVGEEAREVWDDLDLGRQRRVIDLLVDVHLDVAPKGRPPGWQPGEPYFWPESVRLEWK